MHWKSGPVAVCLWTMALISCSRSLPSSPPDSTSAKPSPPVVVRKPAPPCLTRRPWVVPPPMVVETLLAMTRCPESNRLARTCPPVEWHRVDAINRYLADIISLAWALCGADGASGREGSP